MNHHVRFPSWLAVVLCVGPMQLAAQNAVLDVDQVVMAENHVENTTGGFPNGIDINSLLGADRFYGAGYTGTNTLTANVEAGHIWGTGSGHESLAHVTSYFNGTGSTGEIDRHATWVGMLIGGRETTPGDNFQTGIAPGTNLQSGSIATGWTNSAYSLGFSISASSFVTPYDQFFGTADVINSSWGFEDATGSAPLTIFADGLARANPQTTFVLSAGNSGPNANTVGGLSSGSNSITVGALGNPDGYNTVASFSSRGPQDYYDSSTGTVPGVRAAVDISAPGTSLVSAYYGGQTGGNGAALAGSPNGPAGTPSSYTAGIGGTSFAAPLVAGGVALLDDLSYGTGLGPQSRDARIVKSVLLNAADKTANWDNGQADVAGVVRTSQSLDWAVGAGRMNLDRAFDQYTAGTQDVPGLGGGSVAVVGWDYAELTLGNSNDYVITQPLATDSTLTATLAWFRNRFADAGTLQYEDVGFADYNLEIWDASFSTLFAASESLYNDVEHLYWTVPAEGYYGLRVIYDAQVFGNPSSEIYGLSWFGTASLIPEPAALTLLLVNLLATALRRSRRRP